MVAAKGVSLHRRQQAAVSKPIGANQVANVVVKQTVVISVTREKTSGVFPACSTNLLPVPERKFKVNSGTACLDHLFAAAQNLHLITIGVDFEKVWRRESIILGDDLVEGS